MTTKKSKTTTSFELIHNTTNRVTSLEKREDSMENTTQIIEERS
jgi:hypothetical protein